MAGDDIVPGVLEPQPDGNSPFYDLRSDYQKVYFIYKLKELYVRHGLQLAKFFQVNLVQ